MAESSVSDIEVASAINVVLEELIDSEEAEGSFEEGAPGFGLCLTDLTLEARPVLGW